jgi:hypothetical protein
VVAVGKRRADTILGAALMLVPPLEYQTAV